jgi:hypothetical protein
VSKSIGEFLCVWLSVFVYWVCVYVFGCVSLCMGVCLCVWVSVYVYGCVSKCMGVCLCVWVCVYVYG